MNYARGKTWLVPPFARENSVKLLGRDLAQDDPENCRFLERDP